LIYTEINPDDPASGMTRQQLEQNLGLQAFPVALFSNDSYYLHLVLQNGDKAQVIYPPADPSEGAMRKAIETVLKRTSSGFLKTVGLWTPPSTPTQDMFGQMQQPLSTWQLINQQLSQEYTVKPVDLSSGRPPEDIDTLLLVQPQSLDDKARFAIDQFLMRGGSVIIAAGNYKIDIDQFGGGLTLQPVENNLREMLLSYGVDVQQSIVMDEQNTAFPLPVQREVNGFIVQEIQGLNFPFFVDVRSEGLDRESGLTAGLNQVTMNFASPVLISDTVAAGRQVSTLVKSSERSWLRTDTNLNPNQELYGEAGYAVEGEQKSYPLAVSLQGVFTSYFKDKPSPFTAPSETADPNSPPPANEVIPSTVITSPATARLVVIGSGEFLDDIIIQQMSQLSPDIGQTNLQFIQNAVDWSVEDTDLLNIRARGASTRILEPMEERTQRTWEISNYLVALLALLGVSGAAMARRRNEKPMELTT
jgi:ABC-2 type transport system permease protein